MTTKNLSIRRCLQVFLTVLLLPHCVHAARLELQNSRVPELRGHRAIMARQLTRLSDLEFRSGVFYIAAENWRRGLSPNRVYMQTPKATMPIAAGAPVACWTFAKAPANAKLVSTPDVTGETLQTAREALTDAGLVLMDRVDAEPARTESREHASVIEQYPRPDQPVFAGTAVYLRLEKRDVQVEQVVSDTKERARSASRRPTASPNDVELSSDDRKNPAIQPFLLLLAFLLICLVGGCVAMCQRRRQS